MTVVLGQSVTFGDDKGQTSTMRFYVSAATVAAALTDAQAVVTALEALTNASFNGARGAYTSAPQPHAFGSSADFNNVEDKAAITLRTAAGQNHRYRIPAPLKAIFRPDTDTVKTPDAGGDAQQVLLQALVDAMVGKVCSRDGAVLDAYVGGTRGRVSLQRRFNIYTRAPDLDGPGL